MIQCGSNGLAGFGLFTVQKYVNRGSKLVFLVANDELKAFKQANNIPHNVLTLLTCISS